MRFRRKGVGFVKWEEDDIGTSKMHEPTRESLSVFSPDDLPFALEEYFDQIQWPKKEEYQQLLDKYKDKEVANVKLLKKEEDDMLIKPSQQEVFTAEPHPPLSRQYTRVVQETTKFRTKDYKEVDTVWMWLKRSALASSQLGRKESEISPGLVQLHKTLSNPCALTGCAAKTVNRSVYS
jgi:hypothetical protein